MSAFDRGGAAALVALGSALAVGCGAGGACHALEQRGSEIAAEVLEAPLPAAEGGDLTEGTYVCTRYRWYRATDVRAHRCTLRLAGGVADFAEDVRDGAGLSSSRSSVRLTARLVVLGSGSLRAEQICPRPVNLPFDGYTARGGELTLINSTNAQVITFTRQ